MGKNDPDKFWEDAIRDDVVRAGLDPAGCVGMAHVHMLVDEIEQLREQPERIAALLGVFQREVNLDSQPIAMEALEAVLRMIGQGKG